MKTSIIAVFAILFIAMPVIASEGTIDVESAYSVQETADRLENILKSKGMTIFNRINHAQGAKNVGIELSETQLFIFGNPKVGSPLMKCEQRIAIDLPQKALIWEDVNGAVRITYNDPTYLQKRHGIEGCAEVLKKIDKALGGMTQAAATK